MLSVLNSSPLLDDFVWGLIGVYGPNDVNLRHVFF